MNGGRRQLWTLPLAGVLALTLVLTGCGSGADSSYVTQPAAPSQAAQDSGAPRASAGFGGYDARAAAEEKGYDQSGESPAPEAEGGAYVPLEDRKVVRHSDLSLETMEFDDSLSAIARMIAEAGGYIQSQSVDGQSLYYSGQYYERSAQVYARIPADRLDEVTGKVGGLCNIVSQSESVDDITDGYMDAQARLDTLKIQEERLLAILEKAEKLEDVITLESALSQVRYEIESLTASLSRMDSQVRYSFLNITLREVAEYNLRKAQPRNFGERLGASFGRSVKKLGAALEGLLFFLIEEGPVILVYAAILGALILLGRRLYRRWQRKHPAPPDTRGRWTPGDFQQYPQPDRTEEAQEKPPEPPKEE